jgi:hypothetical protein
MSVDAAHSSMNRRLPVYLAHQGQHNHSPEKAISYQRRGRRGSSELGYLAP